MALKIKRLLSVLSVMLLFFAAASVFTGCSDDDDDDYINLIQICNNDDEEYRVKLCRESDGVVVSEFTLGEWYDLSEGKCDLFEDINEGFYYITIHEDNSSSESDRTDRFYMDNGTYRYFRIKSPGEISIDTLI